MGVRTVLVVNWRLRHNSIVAMMNHIMFVAVLPICPLRSAVFVIVVHDDAAEQDDCDHDDDATDSTQLRYEVAKITYTINANAQSGSCAGTCRQS